MKAFPYRFGNAERTLINPLGYLLFWPKLTLCFQKVKMRKLIKNQKGSKALLKRYNDFAIPQPSASYFPSTAVGYYSMKKKTLSRTKLGR